MDSTPAPVALPRGLIFLAFLWLVASWTMTIGLRPPVYPTPASYEPGVKNMLMSVMMGLLVAWPVYRLSQAPTRTPIRQTLLDLVVMLSMAQVVVWPLRLITSWTRERTAAMDATLAAWAILAGAIVASAAGSTRPGVRTLATIGCLALCLLAPVTAWLGVNLSVDVLDLIDLSPLLSIHALGEGKSAPPTAGQWAAISWLAVAGVTAWTALGVSRVFLAHDGGGDEVEPVSSNGG